MNANGNEKWYLLSVHNYHVFREINTFVGHNKLKFQFNVPLNTMLNTAKVQNGLHTSSGIFGKSDYEIEGPFMSNTVCCM